jgi:Winged helix DNA-binding domain
MSNDDSSIVARRIAAQQIVRHTFKEPAKLVHFMGAIQAQDPSGAHWAVGLRLGGRGGDDAVVRALADGTVLRTHLMRWTWQLVTPADLMWMLPLVRPRLLARAATRHRELALDAATLRRAHAALERALPEGVHLTRSELRVALSAAGIAADGPRLSHLLGHAELHGLVASGAPRGKQGTWALLAHRAHSPGSTLEPDQALVELARRYFTSRGPATLADFVWWSGLAPRDARTGLAATASSLSCARIDGIEHWSARQRTSVAAEALDEAHLLPPFDEYLVAYRNRAAQLDPRHTKRLNAGGGFLAPAIVIGGRVVGTWRRTLERSAVTIALAPFQRVTARERAQIAEAARRYGAFLGREVRLV